MSGDSSSGRKLVTSTGGPSSTCGPLGFQTPSPRSGCGKTGLTGGGSAVAFAIRVTPWVSPTASVGGSTTGALFTGFAAWTGAVGFDPPPQPPATTAAA